MTLGRIIALTVAATAAISGQTSAPYFTREGVLPANQAHARSFQPNDLVSIYGRYLAPSGICAESSSFVRYPYPTERCGVTVTVNGTPAGLLAVLENQINLQVPSNAQASGDAAIIVTVGKLASPPVLVPFGKPKIWVSVAGPAYVHMPIWISVDPAFHVREAAYPFSLSPETYGGSKFEVTKNGVLLQPIPMPPGPRSISLSGGFTGIVAPTKSPSDRLPLHLQYRFDTPGAYRVRLLDFRIIDLESQRKPKIVQESEWVELRVLPYSAIQRTRSIEEQLRHFSASPETLVNDTLPGLLALPDRVALRALLSQFYHPASSVRSYVASSLAAFDQGLVASELTPLVREKGITEETARLLDGQENLFLGGHEALLALLPHFLRTTSPLIRTGALQYVIWEPNHAWGKTARAADERKALILDIAPAILDGKDRSTDQLLAQALGSVKNDTTRNLLWRMIEERRAEEQSRIALTWIADSRDLPRLTSLLSVKDPDDPDGARTSSLAYSLHRGYGDAALPYLRRAVRGAQPFFVRAACAQELISAGQQDGFSDLLQLVKERPHYATEAAQFIRDRFPEFRRANIDTTMKFVGAKAGVQ